MRKEREKEVGQARHRPRGALDLVSSPSLKSAKPQLSVCSVTPLIRFSLLLWVQRTQTCFHLIEGVSHQRGESSKADMGVCGHWLGSLEEYRTGNVFPN